jgi:hypothetical protein
VKGHVGIGTSNPTNGILEVGITGMDNTPPIYASGMSTGIEGHAGYFASTGVKGYGTKAGVYGEGGDYGVQAFGSAYDFYGTGESYFGTALA